MTLHINELGEFVDVDLPDHDARRSKVYRSCIDVDAGAFREKMEILNERTKEKRTFTRSCKFCHQEFTTTASNKEYCSGTCQRKDYNRRRREEAAARRRAMS